MKVLFAGAEMVPLVKVGGLGDVMGALPRALGARGHDVIVALPAYQDIGAAFEAEKSRPLRIRSATGKVIKTTLQEGHVRVGQAAGPPMAVWLVDQPEFFARPGIYEDPETSGPYLDDPLRWLSFCLALAPACRTVGWMPDILHANDHHAAPAIPIWQQDGHAPATVFSIHNLAYQGHHDRAVLEYAGLRPVGGMGDPFLHWDGANFMKMGILCSDQVTTVSARYAEEISTDAKFGCGLEGALAARGSDLHGIVNGIDVEEWDPKTDSMLPRNFGVDDLEGKLVCREALLAELGLDAAGPETCVVGMVSRLAEQKGVDLLVAGLERLMKEDLRVVVLGTGDPALQERLEALARRHEGRFAVVIGFDSALAHRIEAGADLFLMPSRFEPCGLNQMYSMRYGTIPVVRRTGGLADTVSPFDPATGMGTGVIFEEESADALCKALSLGMDIVRDPQARRQIMANGMGADFSWERSAKAYESVYRRAIERSRT